MTRVRPHGATDPNRTGLRYASAPLFLALPFALLLASGCAVSMSAGKQEAPDEHLLVGAWRSKIQFKSGAFATFNDLEFMYVFNEGGTMTESSNYDGAPPVPPAYGQWRKVGPRAYEARYVFYSTKAPGGFDEIENGGGWMPAGSGVFFEKIALSDDLKSFTSTITYEAFDAAGHAATGGGKAAGAGSKMGF